MLNTKRRTPRHLRIPTGPRACEGARPLPEIQSRVTVTLGLRPRMARSEVGTQVGHAGSSTPVTPALPPSSTGHLQCRTLSTPLEWQGWQWGPVLWGQPS